MAGELKGFLHAFRLWQDDNASDYSRPNLKLPTHIADEIKSQLILGP